MQGYYTKPQLQSVISGVQYGREMLRNEAIAHGSGRVPTKRIYQYGPNCVRDSRDLRAALATLAERGRARMEEDGRGRYVAINPALLADRE